MPRQAAVSLARASARSAARRLVDSPLIIGSLVTSTRTCGHKGCRCARGHKHRSTYLSVRLDGKRLMVCVPREHLVFVRQCVDNHRQLQRVLGVISRDCLVAFLKAKKGHSLF